MSCDGDCMRSFCIGRDFACNFDEGHCNPMGMPKDLGYVVEVGAFPYRVCIPIVLTIAVLWWKQNLGSITCMVVFDAIPPPLPPYLPSMLEHFTLFGVVSACMVRADNFKSIVLELFVQDSHDPFYCPNCLSKVFRCFSCKKEGKKHTPDQPFSMDSVRRYSTTSPRIVWHTVQAECQAAL